MGAIVCEGNLQVRDRGIERELRVLAVQPQQLGFELVAVELIGGDIGKRAEVRLTVVLKAVILPPGTFPVEAQVVLHEVLAEQVFFHVEHLREVIAPHLDGGLADLLPLGWNLSAFLHQEDSSCRR